MHPKDAPTASPEACLREIRDVVTCLRDGHFTARLREEMPGDAGATAAVVNELLDLLTAFRNEHLRLAEELGVTGRLGGQVALPECTGAWREMADATNRLAANLTNQVRDAGNALRARQAGEPTPRLTAANIAGEFRELRERLNDVLHCEPATPVRP